jgi:hypothetical protein
MEFEVFMKSEDFKDFHDYFHCSRNNNYKFTKDKFETTIEYYQYKYNIKEVDINKCLEKFKINDIPIIPRERIRFYSYVEDNKSDKSDKSDNEENTKTNINNYNINYNDYESLYDMNDDDDFNMKKSFFVFKKSEGNIPMVFKKNIRCYNTTEDIDNDSGISYDFFSGEENESESSENEEIF